MRRRRVVHPALSGGGGDGGQRSPPSPACGKALTHKTNPQINMKKFLVTLFALAAAPIALLAAEFPDISIAELKKAIAEKKVVVIDVNGSESFKSGHIPSAVNFADVKGSLASVLPKEKDALVVAYCGGPSCNAYTRAANAAAQLGYTNVKHLSAGISGWLQAKEGTEK